MNISKFLDPKNDFCFRQVFGTEKNKDVLIHFLNDILGYEGKDQITSVSFLKTIQDPEIAAYRQSIVDVLCQDENGIQIIVEMQLSKHKGFEKRAQYYAAKAYSQQVIKEDENHKKLAVYAKLKAVIFLAIADFVMFKDKTDWKSEHRLLDTKTYTNDLKDFYFIFIELEKFHKTLDQLENIQQKWAYFFKHAHESSFTEIQDLIGKDIIIKRAFEAIDQAAWSEIELRTYEDREKKNMDALAIEEQKIEDAEARGEAKGIEIGEARGEVLGIEKVAINMLRANIDIQIISQATGLSTDEILALKEKS